MVDKGKRKHAGGDGDGSKRKKSSYFSTNSKASLPYKSRGFLISCWSGKEALAAQEAINILTAAYESMQSKEGQGEAPGPSAPQGPVDFASEIAHEVSDLKDRKAQLLTYHRTGVSALVYLEMRQDAEGPGPVELVTAVAREVKETKQSKTRLCIRLLPVENVCHASLEEIREAAGKLTGPHFPSGDGAAQVRFAVAYEHRASVELKRMDVINAIVDQIPQPPHKVDLNGAEKTILVQLLRSCAALSVVPCYKELAKFNLRELSSTDDEQAQAAKAARAGNAKPGAGAAEAGPGTAAAKPEPGTAAAAAQPEEALAAANGHVPDQKAAAAAEAAPAAGLAEGVVPGVDGEGDDREEVLPAAGKSPSVSSDAVGKVGRGAAIAGGEGDEEDEVSDAAAAPREPPPVVTPP